MPPVSRRIFKMCSRSESWSVTGWLVLGVEDVKDPLTVAAAAIAALA